VEGGPGGKGEMVLLQQPIMYKMMLRKVPMKYKNVVIFCPLFNNFLYLLYFACLNSVSFPILSYMVCRRKLPIDKVQGH